jgi:hypothetical protein
MGRYATRHAGRRQGEVAAGKKRQESTDTVTDNLAAGPAISLACKQPLAGSPYLTGVPGSTAAIGLVLATACCYD